MMSSFVQCSPSLPVRNMGQSTQSILEYFSEILLDPRAPKIEFDEWLSAYNSSEDQHVKFILTKCLARVEPINLQTLLRMKTHCSLETCNLLIQICNLNVDHGEIMDWLTHGYESNNCDSHCLCNFINLTLKVQQYWPDSPEALISKMLKKIDELNLDLTIEPTIKRCALSSYMDLLLGLAYRDFHSSEEIKNLFRRLVQKITKSPTNAPTSDNTLDPINRDLFQKLKEIIQSDGGKITSQVHFNQIPDCLILRQIILLKLIQLSEFGSSMDVEVLKQELSDIEKFLKDHFVFSSHVFLDLFIEEDTMILRCLSYLMKIGSISDESIAHEAMEAFVNSIHQDETIMLDWLTSDKETAELTLLSLLIYFKLQLHDVYTLEPLKSFFRRLIQKITNLWTKALFPCNPQPLLKYAYKFKPG